MTRQEKQALLEDYLTFVEGNDKWEIEKFLDSLEMNKEKAIKIIEGLKDAYNIDHINQAIRFAIDYMKNNTEAEEEIIGWVNYYPDHKDNCGMPYDTQQQAKRGELSSRGKVIQLPIRKPQ